MMSIWKYPLDVASKQTLMVPEGSKVLSVHDQRGVMNLWVLVSDTDAPTAPLEVSFMVTGELCPPGFLDLVDFVGTVVSEHHPHVGHIFVPVGRLYRNGR